MTKWEYKSLILQGNQIEFMLNPYGLDGWEAVSASATAGGVIVLLKRPLP